jgi:hypothetical protein
LLTWTDFVIDVPSRLTPTLYATLITELQGSILPSFPFKSSRSQATRIDGAGTKLWNLVVKELRELEGNSASTARAKGQKEALTLSKSLAAFLIDSACAARSAIEDDQLQVTAGAEKGGSTTKRVTHVLLGAARTCLWAHEFIWGTKLLERVAVHAKNFDGAKNGRRLKGEYFVLRVLLASCSHCCH